MTTAPSTSPDGARPRRRAVLLGGGLLGLSAVALVGSNVVRVQRLRRTAAEHAGDLDHAAAVGEGLGPPLRLTVLGDSAARGFGLTDPKLAFPFRTAAKLATAIGRRVEIASLATDGHRTADVLVEQIPQVAALRPDAVVVSVGVNDAIKGTSMRDVETATAALLRQVTAHADGAVVVLVPCPDLSAAPGFPWPLGRLVGWRCRRVARAQRRGAAETGVLVADLPAPGPDAFGVDGFHPGEVGHAGMATVAVDALVRAAKEQTTWISD